MVLEFALSDSTKGDDDRSRTTAVQLADGSFYDHFGIEPSWGRYRTILVSDAGVARSDEPDLSSSWISRFPESLTCSRKQRACCAGDR
jgi:hypothetical protein